MIPEPYRVFSFLVGLAVWLVAVVVATIAYAMLGKPDWLRIVMTLMPLLVLLIAWVTLSLPADSMLRITGFAVVLVILVHLFITRYVGAK